MVGCLLFCLFIILLFYFFNFFFFCESLPSALANNHGWLLAYSSIFFLYSLSTQERDLKQKKLASLGYSVPQGPSSVPIGDFLAAFSRVAKIYQRYKDPDELDTAIENIEPAAPLQPTPVCTIEQRGHVPPTKSIRTQVVRGFFLINYLLF